MIQGSRKSSQQLSPSSFSQSTISNSALVQKSLNSSGVKNILKCFGIKASDVSGMKKDFGTSVKMMESFKDVQMIQVDESKSLALAAMGIENASLALVMQSEEAIALLKKRLKEIKEFALDKKKIAKLLAELGITQNLDSLVFTDESGGVYIIQSQLENM
ncbi:hypothetical protein HOH45_04930 [bacterium]|mgnify:CR=1 FL=1|jgi:hypothetical protein|nr:hypothetical protein [bacterium]